jgi:hypothetical protein
MYRLHRALLQSETQALDDRISEPYGVREQGGISLSGCHPNRVQAKPYKLEYYVRKKDGRALEYFWGWDTTGGKSGKVGIEQFICDKIQSVQATSRPFQPRYAVEF